MGEIKCGWLARTSSTLRIQAFTQSDSLLFVAWTGKFGIPAPPSPSEVFSFWSQSAELSSDSPRALLQGRPVPWADRMQGNARSRMAIGTTIRSIGILSGPDSFFPHGMSAVLRKYLQLVLVHVRPWLRA